MRYFALGCLAFLFSVMVPGVASAEVIWSFRAAYHINADASVSVTETITYDFEGEQRHGIFRTLETDHAQPPTAWYKTRSVGIDDIVVLRDGLAEPYTVSGRDTMEVKIGDAAETITGRHVYTISYTLLGALSYFETGDPELYWNVTGTNWPVEILESEVKVTSDVPLLESSGYCGTVGVNTPCTRFELEDGVGFLGVLLRRGEGVTIGVSVPRAAIPVETHESIQFWIFTVAGLFVGLVYVVITGRRYKYAFDRKDSIVAQYEPFANCEPMYAGALIDDQLDARDISAGLIYLAEQGFITIKKTESKTLLVFTSTDYDITLTRPQTELTDNFLPVVLKIIFGELAEVGDTVHLSDIKRDESQKRANASRLTSLRAALKKELASKGYFEEQPVAKMTIVAIILLCLSIFIGIPMLAGPGALVPLLLVDGICVLVIVAALYRNRRRTATGYEAMNHMLGFKEFLSVTDKERFDFHNAPERSPEQFMKYLPYAIAFGVEEKWAALFADMEISNPSWYQDPDSTGNFAALSLATQMSSLSQNIVTTSSTPRNTSTSRGSSGGGFSGGGGGGGGGGSW